MLRKEALGMVEVVQRLVEAFQEVPQGEVVEVLGNQEKGY